jgi:transcription termination factor Rho
MDIDLNDLRSHSTAELVKLAHQAGIEKATSLGRQDLVFEILCKRTLRGAQVPGAGVLEILPDGFGFLRTPSAAYLPGADDIYVSPSQIRRFHLRTGDYVRGRVRTPKENERYIALIKVEQVNGYDPELQDRPLLFDNLEPTYPSVPLGLEHDPAEHASRVVDLLAPMGLGQRVLVHADASCDVPLLYGLLLRALKASHPSVAPFLLLIQASPEAAASAASLPCEVVATTFDEPANRHTQAAEIVGQRARRLAEAGQQAVVFIHSLTRLCRAYEELAGGTARLGGSGLDSSILGGPRRLLADARALREGGSLTVFASLDPSGSSQLDRAIFEAFQGTSRARIVLDAQLSIPGVFPGIDPLRTDNGDAHRLVDAQQLQALRELRASLPPQPHRALSALRQGLASHSSNAALLQAGLDNNAETGE